MADPILAATDEHGRGHALSDVHRRPVLVRAGAMSWNAVVAGATAAAVLSLILLMVVVGLGLSLTASLGARRRKRSVLRRIDHPLDRPYASRCGRNGGRTCRQVENKAGCSLYRRGLLRRYRTQFSGPGRRAADFGGRADR
jgi:hypothetical protein